MFNVPAEADLDGSVEMLTFMWVATGNDRPNLTPEVRTVYRTMLAANFTQLPAELQALFANGRANNAAIQAEWNAAEPMARIALAQQFQQVLSVMGLVSGAGSDNSAETAGGGTATNADIASNIAWKQSGAGDWSSR
jgi:hypothetical protein